MLVKAFRLFVSSTFSDFAQERELLQNKVFPALDAYCASRGYQFLPIDLRWGVSEEAQLDQRTAEICLGEVRAAKDYPPPNFLIMVGNRYGWVPLPYAIARDEFEGVIAWLKGRWKWGAARALGTAYQLDENHLVPRGLIVPEPTGDELVGAYTLRSRETDMTQLKSSAAWAEFEARLRRTLQQAADHLLRLGRMNAASHQKYFLSVTEQEIALGLPGYKQDSTTGASFTPSSSATKGLMATAFIREIAVSTGAKASVLTTDGDFEHGPLLDALKGQIKRILPAESLTTAMATVEKDGKLAAAYLADFAGDVQRKLEAAIDRHIALVSAIEQSPHFTLQSERDEHRAFGEQKRKIFVGRGNNLAAIGNYIARGSDHPLIVHGRSGLGKSALLASAIAAAEETGADPVVYRFIGASATSSDLRSLLVSLVEDLAARGILQQPAEFETDANKFSDQVRALLSSVSKPVIIFLDALDQLRKPYRLGWLPTTLPIAMRFVISVLNDEAYETDSAVYRTLRQRLAPEAFLEIEPLGAREALKILTALEREARRQLRADQRGYIIGQFEKAGASPLYLRTAFEIARSWKSSHRADAGRLRLAEETTALIAQFMQDLSVVHHHQPELVTRTLGYLTAAKDGLSEKELTDVLARDPSVMQAISSEKHGARTDRLPASVWVRLYRQLAPLLTEKRIDDQPLLQFFHRQVAQVAREQHYESAKSGKAALHAALADYFDSRFTTREGEEGRAIYETRSLSELPHQLHHAGNTARLDQVLMSPDWMQQKLAAFGPRPLIDDYQYARTEAHRLTGRVLQLVRGILARDQRQLLPQLLDRLAMSSDGSVTRFLINARQRLPSPSILTQRPSLTKPGNETSRIEIGGAANALIPLDGRIACAFRDKVILWDVANDGEVIRLEGHTDDITALALLPDGRLASSSKDGSVRLWHVETGIQTGRLGAQGPRDEFNSIAVLSDGRLAAAAWMRGSYESSIQLWDPINCFEISRLDLYSGPIGSLVVLPGDQLAAGSESDVVHLWNPKTGRTSTLQGHSGISALAALPDGRLAASSNLNLDNGIVRLWDLNTRTELARLSVHANAIGAIAFLPDGRLACGCKDGTIRLWEISTGTETACFEGHTDRINALAISPNGRLVSASNDTTIRLWDVKAEGAVAEGSKVKVLTMLPDGRLATGSKDGSIRFWNTNTGVETDCLKGHYFGVHWLAVLPNGLLASGADDRTIRLWDPKSTSEVAQFEHPVVREHTNNWVAERINAWAVLADGRIAYAATSDINLWDLSTGAISRLEGHSELVESLAVLPDARLASGSRDGTIRIWDLRTGTETVRLEGHTGRVIALTVLGSGRLASASAPQFSTSGSRERSIRLWDLNAGVETSCLTGPNGLAQVLTVLSDSWIASGSGNCVRLLNSNTGIEASCLEIDATVVSLVAVSEARLLACDVLGRLHWLEIVD